jgi:hypothetical protein
VFAFPAPSLKSWVRRGSKICPSIIALQDTSKLLVIKAGKINLRIYTKQSNLVGRSYESQESIGEKNLEGWNWPR